MAISYDILKKLLTPDGSMRISVAGSDFETPAIAALWDLALFDGRGILVVNQAQMAADDPSQTITISGELNTGVITGVALATISTGVFVFKSDGTVTAQLKINIGDPGWKLSALYPSLKNSVIDSMTLSAVVLTIDSTAPEILPAGFRSDFDYPPQIEPVAKALVNGVSFQATMDLDLTLKPLLATVIQFPVLISGPVALWKFPGNEYIPAPSVYPQLLLSINGGGQEYKYRGNSFVFNLQTGVVLQEIALDDLSSFSAIPVSIMALRCKFTPAGWGQSLPLRMFIFDSSPSELNLEAGQEFDPQKGVKSQLTEMMNGADISKLLQPASSFPLFSNLSLDYASVKLKTDPWSFESILIAFSILSDPWKPLGDFLVFNSIGFSLSAEHKESDWGASANIYASASFYPKDNVGVVLSGYVSVPDLYFVVDLDVDSKEMNLLAPVQDIVGNSIPLPTITGAAFRLKGNVRESYYSFEAAIKEHWSLAGGDSGLVLTGMNLLLSLNQKTGEKNGSVSGSFTLGGVAILVTAQYVNNSWIFTGETLPGQSPSLTLLLRDLGNYFGFKIPEGFPEIDLNALNLEYDLSTGVMLINATLAFKGAAVNLSEMPLVGKYLDPSYSITLSSVTLNINTGGGSMMSISVVVAGRSETIVLSFDKSEKERAGHWLTSHTPIGINAGSEAGTWIDIQKTIGPLSVKRIGFRLASGGLELMFDASLSFTAFNASILGLGVTVPLKNPYIPAFDISGLSIGYRTSSLTIAGAFMKTANPHYLEFAGELMVRFGKYSLTALGAYATTDPPSLFAFMMINAPLGGPPFFYLNGIAAGFGYNRELKYPPVDKVLSFPLVAGAGTEKNPFPSDPSLSQAMDVMKDYISIATGQNWVAAGVTVSSFGMIDVNALLTVSFGTRFQIGLLGVGSIKVPAESAEPVMFAQLALQTLYIPDEGILKALAQLSPDSYVLSKKCKLSGGFAFCLWSSPSPYAGDFVVTYGGYNPFFTPPEYYPKVPQLAMNWSVSPELVMKGGMYFALTPHAIMAGGKLEGVWKSGSISANFAAYADFLIYWKPFHYDIRMGVSFGVNAAVDVGFVTVNLNVSVGAELHIWGPDFAYRAHIDLDIISFTIGDSENNSPVPAIRWPEFQSSYLTQGKSDVASAAASSFMNRPVARGKRSHLRQQPASLTQIDKPCTNAVYQAGEESNVVNAIISDGVIQDLRSSKVTLTVHPDPADPLKKVDVLLDYLVDPQHFILRTQSLLPSKKAGFNKSISKEGSWEWGTNTYTWESKFGIGPMQLGVSDVSSTHQVTICRLGDCMLYNDFTPAPVIANVPKALWLFEPSLANNLQDKQVLPDVFQGLTLTPLLLTPDHLLPINVKELEAGLDGKITVSFTTDTAPAKDPFGGLDPNTTLAGTIGDERVNNRRADIYQDLYYNGFSLGPPQNTLPMQNADNLQLLSPVVLSYLGETKQYHLKTEI